MRIFCFVLVLGISSTGCSGCDDQSQVAPSAVENQKPGSSKGSIRISPAARRLFDESGTGDAAP